MSAFKFGGWGLAVVLGIGAIILAILDKTRWEYFLYAAVVVYLLSLILKRKKHRR